jgi:hypothetical protein
MPEIHAALFAITSRTLRQKKVEPEKFSFHREQFRPLRLGRQRCKQNEASMHTEHRVNALERRTPGNWIRHPLSLGLLAVAGSMLVAAAGELAGQLPDVESAVHGFPTLFDLQGKKLADGEFTQMLTNDRLHVTIKYDFGNGHRVEEKSAFRQKPRLVQEEWSWNETKNGELFRHFTIDFRTGKATADKRQDRSVKHWSEDLKVEPGRTFSGFGFVLVLKSLRERLVRGEKIELQAVGFSPKPRLVSVDLSYDGVDRLNMAGRAIEGGRLLIHPKIPAIAKVFVDVKDTHIWLTTSRPLMFLRWEGPLAEPDDPLIRVDLLPGERSGPAEPARPQ